MKELVIISGKRTLLRSGDDRLTHVSTCNHSRIDGHRAEKWDACFVGQPPAAAALEQVMHRAKQRRTVR